MKRRVLSVLFSLLLLFSMLTVGTGIVKAETGDYVLIRLNNGNYQYNATAIANIDFTYNGIGTLSVELIDNRTLKINLSGLGDFLKLFAPPGFSTSVSVQAPSKTVLDDIIAKINANSAVIDTSLNSVVSITINDVTLVDSFGYSSVKVTVLGQDTYKGEDYNVTVSATSTAYVVGWRNNRGTIKIDGVDYSASFYPNPYSPITLDAGDHWIATITGETYGNGYTTIAFSVIALDGDYTLTGQLEHANYVVTYTFEPVTFNVQFSLKDALSGQSLTGVTIKEGNTTIGTIDDGQSLALTKGTHTLTFEKNGYWSVTLTIDVQSDMSVSVEMYPSSAAFQFLNFPQNLSFYQDTVAVLQFSIKPLSDEVGYGTYLTISGLSDVLYVKKDGQEVQKDFQGWYLGEVRQETQIEIAWKVGSTVGMTGFSLGLSTRNVLGTESWTQTKQVTYEVKQLPFRIQFPAAWVIGTNELRITEQNGGSYLITVILKDENGTEVWSDSYAFNPYEAHTFYVEIPKDAQYTLEIQWAGYKALYDVQLANPISLINTEIVAKEGETASVGLKIKNPSTLYVNYYTIKVYGGFLNSTITKTVSVAPGEEKIVYVDFEVPENLEFDSYNLNVEVLKQQTNETVFSATFVVKIDDSGFSFIGGSSSNYMIYAAIAVLVLIGLAVLLRRR